ncbi:hypothetical protein PNOK_0754300 [Pyrrhoderma noxium]|uniref:Uncharacterized protein n=1 Tax=Pyrrhoderma noxium TaxID=2282107 RepID=A0A286UD73_9AGAM|nr:hypothetical protein PNOK_0754300 [Pyrrhoderma noxium]
MPLHIPGSHASSSIQTYNDVGGTQINGGNVTMTDGRNVAHKVSSTEEGTRLGNSLISDTGGIADGNKLTHREVSATGTGDKPVVDEESMKEVANVLNNGNFKEIMALIFWFLSWIPYLTKPKTAS